MSATIVRKGLLLKLLGVLVWAAGLCLFVFGVAPYVSGLEWRADLAIVLGAVLGAMGYAAIEFGDRYLPPGSLEDYARCDPDLSQSWAVGIALGGGLDCGGGGGDGGGAGC